jgi:hypothetical protein
MLSLQFLEQVALVGVVRRAACFDLVRASIRQVVERCPLAEADALKGASNGCAKATQSVTGSPLSIWAWRLASSSLKKPH